MPSGASLYRMASVEVAFSFVHLFGISAQARFDVFNLLAWD